MKRKLIISLSLLFCLMLFPLTVNSQTTTGRIEFYQEDAILNKFDESEKNIKKQVVEQNTTEQSDRRLGQFGEKVENSLVIIGMILIGIALYYFDKNRRILK
ncbi:LPXTG cell wall anchor domain-containing protein [Enterococcus sp.]|uniref:LPXTG cell wall anchor domain-containing protein n=1 Tax=Enterococcus sp. TaxID=35783 RepID=UPI002FC7065C